MRRLGADTLAALTAEEEEIRRRLSQEHPHVIDSAMRIVKDGEARSVAVRLAALKLLHSLSRSVEQLRTAFQDNSDAWIPLLNVPSSSAYFMGDEEALQIIRSESNGALMEAVAAVLANLVLEFSPGRDSLLEAGVLDVLTALARRTEENLCLSGVWGLMVLSCHSPAPIISSTLP